MKAGKENTDSSLLHRLQDLTNKLDSLYKLVEAIWHVLQEEEGDDDSYAPSDASTVELAE